MVAIGIVKRHQENIAPNPDGYRLSELERVLSDDERATNASAELVPEEGGFRDAEDGGDPLSSHIKYIARIRMRGPFVGSQKQLIAPLEKCLHRFVQWELYKNDMRYVRLWLEYSTLSHAPQTVLRYMESQRIAWFSSQFYETWANLCETRGNVSKALSIVDRGLERDAQPATILRDLRLEICARHPSVETDRRKTKKRRPSEPRLSRSKKVKVFVESDESSDGSEPEPMTSVRPFPFLSNENRENEEPALPLVGHVLNQAPAASTVGGRVSEPLRVFRDSDEELSANLNELVRSAADDAEAEAVDEDALRGLPPELQLLEIRHFTQPMREFDPVRKSLEAQLKQGCDCNTGVIGPIDSTLAAILYAQHAGHTERIPDFWGSTGPPTEQLR